jgi:branched-chain amino acid transport system permease protein
VKLLCQLLLNGMASAGLYAMIAVGFGVVYRSTGVFHLAYGGLYVIASYALFSGVGLAHLPVAAALPLALLVTAAVGLGIEKCVYLPFYRRRASGGVVLIASLGVLIVIENGIALAFGNEARTITVGIEPSMRFAGLVLTRIQLIQFGVGSGAVLALWVMLRKWSIAQALWAMGDEPELIPVIGLPVRHLRALVFILSSLLIAIPACLISLDVGMDPHVGMNYLLIGAVAVFFGGVESFWGWTLGAVVLALLQSLAVWKFSARWTDLVTFGMLVAMLLFRPCGMLGSKRRIEESAN